ncbi:plant cysteine oxidase 1-like [Cocos nucifera]|uniref:cysteine dioxygenase n=1 Tax=Cocos nucifera TaxID=13894 RepID=A0A8K0NBA4_COCNU|nr:plant cysteine oxidase 1-like [Cocos nucifera]
MAIHFKGRSKVQRLYDAGSMVFSSEKKGSPTFKQIRWLQGILDGIEPVDVGIDGSNDGRSQVDESSIVSRDGLIIGQALTQITWVNVAGGLAKVVADDQVLQAPCKASVLFPRRGGNIHSFTALTPCAILDVLAPPYAEERGRPSNYYSETPIPSLPGYSILKKRGLPEDLVVVGAPYLGPELIVDADFK